MVFVQLKRVVLGGELTFSKQVHLVEKNNKEKLYRKSYNKNSYFFSCYTLYVSQMRFVNTQEVIYCRFLPKASCFSTEEETCENMFFSLRNDICIMNIIPSTRLVLTIPQTSDIAMF